MEDKKIFSFQDYLEYQDKVNKSLHNDESTLFFNTSLNGVSSPRANEPNNQAFCIGCVLK